MKKLKIKIILASFGIQFLFLAGLLLLHLNFTLPIAQIEGVDVLAQPGNTIKLCCMAKINPPGWKNLIKKDLKITFFNNNNFKLNEISNSEGLASGNYKVDDNNLLTTSFFISLNYDKQFSYHRMGASLLVESVSKGAEIILCELSSTLEDSSWEELDQYKPSMWNVNVGAVQALQLYSSGALRKVIYFCPGKKLLTTEAREYVNGIYRNRNDLPEGVVLFPEAPPRSQSFVSFFSELKKKWPYIKAGISNRKEVIKAFLEAKIPVIAFDKRAIGGLTPGMQIQYGSSWTELNNLIK